MIAYVYDGTYHGLLCALFCAYEKKETPYTVVTNEVQLMFGSGVREIITEKEKALRVDSAIKKYLYKTTYNSIFIAMRNGDNLKSSCIFDFLKLTIDEKKDLSKDFSNPIVLQFNDLIRQVNFEVHRFKGFIRFEESESGYYYAHFEPDNDIVELLVTHFYYRYKEMPFILHDVKRNILAMSYKGETKIIKADNKIEVYLSEKESEFQSLWKQYYNSVNIASRKHERQMKNYMPVRYWKHLPEKK